MKLVNWDTCCQPLSKGKLGLKRLIPQNKSYLMKLVYQMVTKVDALWVHILLSKYKLVEVRPSSIVRPICSDVWRSLNKIWHLFCDKIYWSIENGQIVRFFPGCLDTTVEVSIQIYSS